MSRLIRYVLFVMCASAACAPLVGAASVPQEIYISSAGNVHARGVTVAMIHALNLISVNVWAQKWTVSMDYATAYESSDGTAIKPEQIAPGHVLEIKGRLAHSADGAIDASLVRDLSIGSAASGGSILDLICMASAAVRPTPSPMPAPTSLAHTLALGAKNLEVSLLQAFLRKKGFGIPDDGPVSGYFGKVTEDAVKKFQQANTLEATGTTGPKTRTLINSTLGAH